VVVVETLVVAETVVVVDTVVIVEAVENVGSVLFRSTGGHCPGMAFASATRKAAAKYEITYFY